MGITQYPKFDTDFLTEVSKGNIPGHSLVSKFGAIYAVGTSYAPCSVGGLYNTPQVAAATTLRVKAGDANDTAAGSGAREIIIIGLDQTGAEVTEVLATAGASASSATTTTFIRLYRAYVSKSGTYASASAGSHAADIVIENGAGGTDWATISSVGFPHSQSEIGAYSVPLGKTAYLLDYRASSNALKSFDFLFFKRESILDAAAPYEAMRVQYQGAGITTPTIVPLKDPPNYSELTDIGFMVKSTTTTADIIVEFNILLVDN